MALTRDEPWGKQPCPDPIYNSRGLDLPVGGLDCNAWTADECILRDAVQGWQIPTAGSCDSALALHVRLAGQVVSCILQSWKHWRTPG